MLFSEALGFTLIYNSAIFGWSTDHVVLHLNTDECTIPASQVEAIVDDAVKIWSSVSTSRLTLSRGESFSGTGASAIQAGGDTSGYPSPAILCASDFSHQLGDDGNYIPAFSDARLVHNQIAYSYVIINAEAGKKANIANVQVKLPGKMPVVLAHEIGHALGLGHSADTGALMYYDLTDRKKITLTEDDADGITYLYPRQEPSGGKSFGCTPASANVTSAEISAKSGHPSPADIQGWQRFFEVFFGLPTLLIGAYFLTRSRLVK